MKQLKKQYKCKRLRFIQTLKESKSLVEAMQSQGIDYETFIEWCDKYTWFSDAVKGYDDMRVFIIEDKLLERIDDGDLRAIELYMKYIERFRKIDQNLNNLENTNNIIIQPYSFKMLHLDNEDEIE